MTKLKSKFIILFLTAICFALVFQVPFALGDTKHFDPDGNIVDKIHYEILVAEREKIIEVMLRDGYSSESATWRDPIKLRKKRIFQWQIMRSLYNRESLPEKLKTTKES